MHLDARLGNGARCPAGLLHGAAFLLGLGTLGCGDSPETVRLDVYSWWTQPEEKVAFDAVARMHQERHPNVVVQNLDKGDEAAGARQEMSMRMLANAPPATFLANIGADVLKWAVVDTQSVENAPVELEPDSSHSFINPLDELFDDTGLTVPSELEENLRIGPETGPFGVPLNIHRVNVLYYNVANRRRFEQEAGKDLLLIDTWCPRDADPSTPPLGNELVAIPLASSWTLILLVFENILPALIARDPELRQDYYKYLFSGERWRDEGKPSLKVEEALVCAQHLSRSMLSNSVGMGWASAVRAVADGTATFAVMGDWANPLLKKALADDIVRAVPFPGTNDIYVYTSDTFPLPIGVEYPAETIELLKTFASKDGQIVFSKEKGSIPARQGTGFVSPPGWATFDQWQGATHKLLATSGYFPPYYLAFDLGEKLVPMMGGVDDPGTRAAALRFFTDLEPLLTRWSDRLRDGPAEPRPQ